MDQQTWLAKKVLASGPGVHAYPTRGIPTGPAHLEEPLGTDKQPPGLLRCWLPSMY